MLGMMADKMVCIFQTLLCKVCMSRNSSVKCTMRQICFIDKINKDKLFILWKDFHAVRTWASIHTHTHTHIHTRVHILAFKKTIFFSSMFPLI